MAHTPQWASRLASLTDDGNGRELAVHLVMIGGSDAGISAALRARELITVRSECWAPLGSAVVPEV